MDKNDIIKFIEIIKHIELRAQCIGNELNLIYNHIEYDYNKLNVEYDLLSKNKHNDENPLIVKIHYMRYNCQYQQHFPIKSIELTMKDLLSPSGFINKIRLKKEK